MEVENEAYHNYGTTHQSPYRIPPLAAPGPDYVASQSPLSSIGDETRHLSIALHANMGVHNGGQYRSTAPTADESLGWIDVTYGDGVLTPVPRQLQLSPYPSTAPPVTPTIIHAPSDFCLPATQAERMEEDYDVLGSPRRVRSN
jgi:hypothetical protein